MGVQLSFFWKPEQGDKGSEFCPKLEDNIDNLDIHDHDGANSTKIAASSITKSTDSIALANWSADGDEYTQTVTLPTNYSYDTTKILCKIGSGSEDGDVFYPTINKVSTTQFEIRVIDNTIDVDFLYS